MTDIKPEKVGWRDGRTLMVPNQKRQRDRVERERERKRMGREVEI